MKDILVNLKQIMIVENQLVSRNHFLSQANCETLLTSKSGLNMLKYKKQQKKQTKDKKEETALFTRENESCQIEENASSGYDTISSEDAEFNMKIAPLSPGYELVSSSEDDEEEIEKEKAPNYPVYDKLCAYFDSLLVECDTHAASGKEEMWRTGNILYLIHFKSLEQLSQLTDSQRLKISELISKRLPELVLIVLWSSPNGALLSQIKEFKELFKASVNVLKKSIADKVKVKPIGKESESKSASDKADLESEADKCECGLTSATEKPNVESKIGGNLLPLSDEQEMLFNELILANEGRKRDLSVYLSYTHSNRKTEFKSPHHVLKRWPCNSFRPRRPSPYFNENFKKSHETIFK